MRKPTKLFNLLTIIACLCFLSIVRSSAQDLKEPIIEDAKGYFFEGLKEKYKENYAAAASNFERYLRHYPKDDAALYELSSAQFKIKNLINAEINVTKAITLNRSNIWYYKLKAEILTSANDISQLIVVYDQLIRLEPEKFQHYLDKGKALYFASRMEEVATIYKEFESKFGDRMELREAKKNMSINTLEVELDVETLKAEIKESPNDHVNYALLANLYLKDGLVDEALDLLNEGQAKANDHFELALAEALVYRLSSEPELALECVLKAFRNPQMPFDRKFHFVQQLLAEYELVINKNSLAVLGSSIIELHPKESKAYFIYGEALFRLGKIYEAAAQYKKSLDLNDQNFVVWEKLISIYVSQQNYEVALSTVDNALSSYPNQAILIYYKELSKNRLGMLASKSDLDYALRLIPNNFQLRSCIYGLMAEIDFNLKKFNSSNNFLELAFKTFPDNTKLYNTYAFFLASKKVALGYAFELIKKAIDLDSDNKAHYFTESFILLKMGEIEESERAVLKALRGESKDNPIYLEHYGDVLSFKGMSSEAKQHWQRAAQMGRNSLQLKNKINE